MLESELGPRPPLPMSLYGPSAQKPRRHHDLLITLPVFNEGGRLERSVERVLATLDGSNLDYGIALVEDGSSDGSAAIARELSGRHPFIHAFHSDERLGRGEAIRRCWRRLDADTYLFMDTDLSANLDALPALLNEIKNGQDIVTGSRYCQGAHVVRPPLRHLVSIVYNGLVQALFHDAIKDHQCGFKAFSRQAVRGLIPITTEPTWFWDTEVLVLGRVLGYNVAEIPITWTEMKTKRTPIGRLLSDILIHGVGLLRLRSRISRLKTRSLDICMTE